MHISSSTKKPCQLRQINIAKMLAFIIAKRGCEDESDAGFALVEVALVGDHDELNVATNAPANFLSHILTHLTKCLPSFKSLTNTPTLGSPFPQQ